MRPSRSTLDAGLTPAAGAGSRSGRLVWEPCGRLLVSTQQAEVQCRGEAPKSVAVPRHA